MSELFIDQAQITMIGTCPPEHGPWRLEIIGLPVIIIDDCPPDFISLANLGTDE